MAGPAACPPRAQAAHQQAAYLARSLKRRLAGAGTPPFRYRDFGSLVSIGAHGAVGTLVAGSGGNMLVAGRLAGLMYLSLYKKRELALHGFVMTALSTLSRWIDRRTAPRVKLH